MKRFSAGALVCLLVGVEVPTMIPSAEGAPPAVPTSPFTPPSPVGAAHAGEYRLSGDKSLWPSTVTDDGAKTYIRWADDQPIPAVFASERKGEEETINGYMRNGSFTIDRVYDHLIFRIDKVEASAVRVTVKKRYD